MGETAPQQKLLAQIAAELRIFGKIEGRKRANLRRLLQKGNQSTETAISNLMPKLPSRLTAPEPPVQDSCGISDAPVDPLDGEFAIGAAASLDLIVDAARRGDLTIWSAATLPGACGHHVVSSAGWVDTGTIPLKEVI